MSTSTRTKHGANKVVKILVQSRIGAEAIHGNKSQTARQNALKQFKEGKLRALVATDIAARGIDIDGLSHVINFDIPNIPETYVHNTVAPVVQVPKAVHSLFATTRRKTTCVILLDSIKRDIPVVEDHPFLMVGGPKSGRCREKPL